MNPLLKRQLRKYLPDDLKDREDLNVLFRAVSDSYNTLDNQFKMTQRAMMLSSEELFEANKSLREETAQQKALLDRLQAVINRNNASKENEPVARGNLAEYISEQAEELIRVNENQELLLKELALQNQELNDYAHIVSHDLKSPLRSIEALISWLQEDYEEALGSDGKEQIKLIVSHLEKMDALISGILSYSSIDKDLRKEREIDLNTLLKDVVNLQAVPSNVAIKIKHLPTITADKVKIQQLFQNLIGNAVANMDKPEGKITVSCEIVARSARYKIKDNGKGINKAYFEKIFQIFQKLDSHTEGTGIGLSIVKKIVSFYGGKIWLESEEGVGTTFYFTLPHTT